MDKSLGISIIELDRLVVGSQCFLNSAEILQDLALLKIGKWVVWARLDGFVELYKGFIKVTHMLV